MAQKHSLRLIGSITLAFLHGMILTSSPVKETLQLTLSSGNPLEQQGFNFTIDKLGHLVVITKPYTLNTISYPSMVYQFGNDCFVKKQYNVTEMLSAPNHVTIAPLLTTDGLNNYWICIDGNALVCINTTTDTATKYDLSPDLAHLGLSTITPTGIYYSFGNIFLHVKEVRHVFGVIFDPSTVPFPPSTRVP